MPFLPLQIVDKINIHRPEQLTRKIDDSIISLNHLRMKWFCLGFVCISLLMLIIDYHTLVPGKKYDLHYYYLWFDTILFGIGLLFYLLLSVVERRDPEGHEVKKRIVFAASMVLLIWCGAVGALEHFTHHSVSTIIIGILGMACAIYHTGREISIIYAAGLAAFIVSKLSFSEVPVHFFLDHINLIPLAVFGWFLSRVLYANKLQSMIQQQQINEKNSQLAREVAVREKAESELRIIHKDLENRVEERTRELLIVNRTLQNEVNERKKIQNKLNHAQKMELIGTMASGIAHDLNNVLSGVNTYPELLLMEMAYDDPMRKPLETIHQSGQKAAQIIQDMLILARRGVPIKDLVNLNDIIKEYVTGPEFSALRAVHPKVDVKMDLAEGIPLTKGSKTHLSTAVMNIVTNAAESMPDGGSISIQSKTVVLDAAMEMCKVVSPGNYIHLSISDSGVGIAPEDKEKIFEPFYTNKTMGKSGTGLGMAIVWGMVKDHKGYIEVKSNLGHGTTFSLYLPAQQSGTDKDEEKAEMPVSFGNGEKILVVDDLEEQLFFAKTILEKYNYRVKCVQGGEAAFEYLKDHTMDLVILDMNMDPGINGLETYRKITRIHPGQKTIIASGYASEELIEAACREGITTFIKKPYSVGNLNSAVTTELAAAGNQ